MDHVQREAHKRYSTAIAEGDAMPTTPFKVKQLDPCQRYCSKGTVLFTGGFASCR